MDTTDIQDKLTFLTFRLDTEKFAVSIDKASSIIEMLPITKVPRSPDYMKGIINVRGNVLPVIDTRMKFGMNVVENTKNTVIITFNIDIEGEKADVGAIVDEPGTIIEIDEDEVLSAPSIGAKYKSELIKGAIKVNDEFIMILDVDKVFTLDELIEIVETEEEHK